MASQNGVNYAKRLADPAEKIKAQEQYGRMRVSYDKVTLSSELAIGEQLLMGVIPKGAKLYGVKIKHDGLGTTGILKLVVNGEDLVTGIDVKAAAGVKNLPSAFADDMPKDVAAESQLVLEATEATDAGDTKVVEVWAHYAID